MPYTKNIPLTGESLGSTRARIAENFLEIFDVESVNHVSFNDSGAGKHKFMQMPEQGSAPATAVNEGALYTKDSSSVTTLFFRKESNGTEIPLVGSGGFVPTILTGSAALTTSAANIAAVPANSWGNIFLSRQTNRTQIQSGFFFSDGTKAYAYSHKIKQNGSSSFDIYVSLINNPAGLFIRGNTDSGSYDGTYDYKIVYWI